MINIMQEMEKQPNLTALSSNSQLNTNLTQAVSLQLKIRKNIRGITVILTFTVQLM